MDVLSIVGIVLLVYLLLPTFYYFGKFIVRKQNKTIQLEKFPGGLFIFHLILSVFIFLSFFLKEIWAISMAAVFYIGKVIFMLITSKEMQAAKNTRSEGTTQKFLEQLRKVQPRLNIHIKCWHTEVYYETEHYTDSNGNRETRQTRRERQVTTYTENRYIQITGWYDQTPPLILQENYRNLPVISLELHNSVTYHEQSGLIVQRMISDAYNENRHRDQHCDASLERVIPGLTEYNYLCASLPFYMKRSVQVLAILLLFDTSLVFNIRANTPKCQLVVKKVVSLMPKQVPQQEVPVTDIQPPTFCDNIDEIEPPAELMPNTEPFFANCGEYQSDFDEYKFDLIEPPQVAQGYVGGGAILI